MEVGSTHGHQAPRHWACSRGIQVGGSVEELGLARRLFDASETRVLYEAERGSSRSVHVLDPDGNEIELYVDISECSSRHPVG